MIILYLFCLHYCYSYTDKHTQRVTNHEEIIRSEGRYIVMNERCVNYSVCTREKFFHFPYSFHFMSMTFDFVSICGLS